VPVNRHYNIIAVSTLRLTCIRFNGWALRPIRDDLSELSKLQRRGVSHVRARDNRETRGSTVSSISRCSNPRNAHFYAVMTALRVDSTARSRLPMTRPGIGEKSESGCADADLARHAD